MVFALVFFVAKLVLAVFAVLGLADAARRPTGAFAAAGKLTKGAWVGILAVSLVVALPFFGGFGILALAAVVAVTVYHVDVKPAVAEVSGGSRW